MAFNPQITVADAVKQGLLVPLQASNLSAVASTPTIPAQTTAPVKAAHTTGEWKLIENANSMFGHSVVIYDRLPDTAALTLHQGHDLARARLIAAAPQLLAALQAIVAAAQTGKITAGSNYFTEAASLIGQADAAITQATL